MKRNCYKLGLFILLLGVTFSSKFATGAATAEASEQPKPLSAIEQKMLKKVSVDFRETPIDDVLRIMTKQADVDMVKSPLVEGVITATVTDIPLSEALENILGAHGYAYITSDSMIRIVPRSEVLVTAEATHSKVYRIVYADTDSVAKSLIQFLSDRGEMAVNVGTSNIMVTDTQSKLDAIDAYIAEVDRITPQMVVEVRIYDVSSRDRLDYGVNWAVGTNTLFDDAGMVIGGITNPYGVAGFDGTTNFTEATDGAMRFGILNDHVNIDAIIRLEEEDVDAKLLANPRVMVLDNEIANIKIISEIPYQELTQTAGGGSIGTTEFKDVGVELTVRPHLTRDGMIRLHIRPKFSIQTGEIAVSSAGVSSPQPIVDTREADTIALVMDGDTVVIGGLRKKDMRKQINKIPILGDIPLVDFFFKYEGEEEIVSELVVFITPKIVGHRPSLSEREAEMFEDGNFEVKDRFIDDETADAEEDEWIEVEEEVVENPTDFDTVDETQVDVSQISPNKDEL